MKMFLRSLPLLLLIIAIAIWMLQLSAWLPSVLCFVGAAIAFSQNQKGRDRPW